MGSPNVSASAMPHERWGEVPRAFVAVHPGATVTPDELAAWCRERLAGFKVPKDWVFLDELPKGGTGKIQKPVLRAWDR